MILEATIIISAVGFVLIVLAYLIGFYCGNKACNKWWNQYGAQIYGDVECGRPTADAARPVTELTACRSTAGESDHAATQPPEKS